MQHALSAGKRKPHAALLPELVDRLLRVRERQEDRIVFGNVAVDAPLRAGLRDVDLQVEDRWVLREISLQHVLWDRSIRHLLGVEPVRVHRLRVFHVIGEALLLRVERLRRVAAQDDLLLDERREELVEVGCDSRGVGPLVDAADVREDLGLLPRLASNPAKEDLGVREHLVVGPDATEDIGERAVLPDERVLGKSHQHGFLSP